MAVVMLAVSASAPCVVAQDERTIGVVHSESGMQPGYTLFSPQSATKSAYLIDELGRVVNTWTSAYQPGNSVYLLESGELLRTGNPGGNGTINSGGAGGQVERFSWDGDLLWSWRYSTGLYRAHHDIEPLPDGNILIIAWEYRTAAETLAVGRLPGTFPNSLWPDQIIEIEPVGTDQANIVWEWHAWDHLIQDTSSSLPNYGNPSDHPRRIDINFRNNENSDWLHLNGIDYNDELDHIVVSSPTFKEIWIIDHGTTTEEAAGPAGDLLWRWGNPQAYGRGTPGDQTFYFQHDPKWVRSGMPGEGDITVFNNGQARPEGQYSSIDQVTPPLAKDGTYTLEDGESWGPEEMSWTYVAPNPTDFFASRISGAQRQPNGNTLICEGPCGDFFEVAEDGELKWRYINPLTNKGPQHQGDPPPGSDGEIASNNSFRAERYTPDYAGFDGRDMTPGDYLEIYPECIGDVNNDRIVNGADLTMILGAWGSSDSDADLDGNGTVGGEDLSLVLGFWGYCQDI